MAFDTLSRSRFATPLTYAGFLVLVFAIGGIAGLATASQITGWYSTVVKPSFSPPNWLFGPVWSVLYVMIAVTGARIVLNTTAPRDWRRQALMAFCVQLALNAAWSPVFFGLHAIGSALMIIVGMWISIVATIWLTWRFDRLASWLLVPYLCWVSFAGVLNAALFRLN